MSFRISNKQKLVTLPLSMPISFGHIFQDELFFRLRTAVRPELVAIFT